MEKKLHSHFCSFSRTLPMQASTECNRPLQVTLTTIKQKYVLNVLLNIPFSCLNKTHKTSLLLLLLLLLSMLSLLCRVFTIIYLKQTTFLGYRVLQLFCIYNLCYIKCFFAPEICFVLSH